MFSGLVFANASTSPKQNTQGVRNMVATQSNAIVLREAKGILLNTPLLKVPQAAPNFDSRLRVTYWASEFLFEGELLWGGFHRYILKCERGEPVGIMHLRNSNGSGTPTQIWLADGKEKVYFCANWKSLVEKQICQHLVYTEFKKIEGVEFEYAFDANSDYEPTQLLGLGDCLYDPWSAVCGYRHSETKELCKLLGNVQLDLGYLLSRNRVFINGEEKFEIAAGDVHKSDRVRGNVLTLKPDQQNGWLVIPREALSLSGNFNNAREEGEVWVIDEHVEFTMYLEPDPHPPMPDFDTILKPD